MTLRTPFHSGREYPIAGDFNAKALEWGVKHQIPKVNEDLRLGLIVPNTGLVSTFRRPRCGETITDITLASECLPSVLTDWKVEITLVVMITSKSHFRCMMKESTEV